MAWEARLPGLAWLEFHVEQDGESGRTRLRQKATFKPNGLFGTLYWAVLVPFHGPIFGGMARNICRAAEDGTGMALSAYRPTPRPGAVPGRR